MRKILSIYFQLNNSEKHKFHLIFLFTVILIFLEMLSLGLILPIITLVINADIEQNFEQLYFLNRLDKKNQIIIFLIALIFAYTIKNTCFGLFTYFKKKFLADITIDFTSRIYYRYINQSYSFYLRSDKSEIIRNIGIVGTYSNILENFYAAFLEFLILIGIIIFIFFKNFYVGLFISLTALLFLLIANKLLQKRFKKYGELNNIFSERILNSYINTFSSIRDIILQKKQNFFLKDFKENLSKQTYVNVKNSFFGEVPRLFIELIIIISICFLVFFLFLKSQNINDIIITIAFITALIFRAIPSISRINYNLNNLAYKMDVIKKVNELIKKFDDQKKDLKKEKNITFENLKLKQINFSYQNSKRSVVFKNLNLEIKKNEAIGIVGFSGSGKSTLIDLIIGMLEPDSGEILLNNNQLDNKIINSWHSKISCISQKNYILNSTIKNNVAFGENENEINYEKVIKCLQLSKIKYLIDENKDGLNFPITEDGKNLSGGQRQRILIARALYKNSEILIFDEATTGLDKEVEQEIFDDIKKNFYGSKTLIISTHNHNLLKFCDKIVDVNKI